MGNCGTRRDLPLGFGCKGRFRQSFTRVSKKSFAFAGKRSAGKPVPEGQKAPKGSISKARAPGGRRKDKKTPGAAGPCGDCPGPLGKRSFRAFQKPQSEEANARGQSEAGEKPFLIEIATKESCEGEFELISQKFEQVVRRFGATYRDWVGIAVSYPTRGGAAEPFSLVGFAPVAGRLLFRSLLENSFSGPSQRRFGGQLERCYESILEMLEKKGEVEYTAENVLALVGLQLPIDARRFQRLSLKIKSKSFAFSSQSSSTETPFPLCLRLFSKKSISTCTLQKASKGISDRILLISAQMANTRFLKRAISKNFSRSAKREKCTSDSQWPFCGKL